MKIVSYRPPWCIGLFETIFDELGAQLGRSIEHTSISCFDSTDTSGFWEKYKLEIKRNTGKPQHDMSDDEEDIIKRCRLLRSMDNADALLHVRTTQKLISEILDKVKPGLVFAECIDQYLTDILFREAEKRNIRLVAFVRIFVNGYYRVTMRGEYNRLRDVTSGEIQRVKKELLSEKYIPENLVSIKRNLVKRYYSVMFANILRYIWFSLVRILPSNRYNYHYWSSSRCTWKEYLHLIPRLSFGQVNWREKLSKSQKPIVFIPLQHVPEATVDYWTEKSELIEYEKVLGRLIEQLSGDFTVMVKEHPGVWGFRKPSFYKKLDKYPELVVAPVSASSQECCEMTDAVLVWTGTIGFEAALRGLKVLTLSPVYYASGPLFKEISLDTPISEIKEFIESPIDCSGKAQNDMIEHVLSGCYRGFFRNNGTFDNAQQDYVIEAQGIARDIVTYLKQAN